jgi:hypothetical protein
MPLPLPDVMHYARGETRITWKRGADSRFWLQVNDGEPTPLSPAELGDFLFYWNKFYRQAGYVPQPFTQLRSDDEIRHWSGEG